MSLSPAQATLELTLLNSRALTLDRIDVFTHLTNAGLSPEVVLRLEELWDATKVVAGKIIHAGKIIILEIMRFIEANPNLVIGVALGAAVGALVTIVPFIGALLAPLTITVGAAIGGVVGSRLDRVHSPEKGAMGIAQEVIILARKFFELLVEIFKALQDQYEVGQTA